ncbi:hypothetical protein [Mesonia sp. K4-1]|uniref:hypothetical protein n=1 Tax=Mesonia sp. K4-1 TaxID=2602760 RepID=UPI0011CC3C47|nr:hypothetical protein [Mesonia sp. K4-1]TXK75371.1 hypothetical protein FT986_10060 [Mesonia sp. K4-1]
MKLNFKKVSESDFEKIDIPVLFENKLTDTTYAVISNYGNEYKYKLGWQSESISPTILNIDKFIFSIGIDQIFVIFELHTGNILKRISLDYYFYDIKIFKEILYVITQLEIIKINITDLMIIEYFALPDYFESIEFEESVIYIKCINGEILNI